MNVVQANKCVIQARIFGEFTTVLCAKRISVDVTTGIQEITNEVDGFFKSFDYKDLEYTITLESVHLMQDGSTPVAFDFLDRQLQFLETDIRIIFRGQNSGLKVFTGNVIVNRGNSEMAANELAGSTIELLGSGAYTLEDILPETVDLRILITGDPTEGFLIFKLLNDDGEAIFQTDILPQASGGNLANPLDLTVPVPKGNWYYWFQFNSNAIGNTFDLNAPPVKHTDFNNGVFNETSYPSQLYDFTANRTLTVTVGVNDDPPVCVPVTSPSSPTFANATVGIPYSTSFAITGSAPFNFVNVTKPAWMTLAFFTPVPGGTTYVTASGTPDVAGANIVVAADITNDCGSTSFSSLLTVISNSNQIPINYDFTRVPNLFSVNSFRIYVNSILRVQLNQSGAGTEMVNPGDEIEVRVIGTSTMTAVLQVTDNIFGVIHFYNGPAPDTYSFTALNASHVYDIDSSLTN